LTVHATTPTRAATKILYAGYVKWTKKEGQEKLKRKERKRKGGKRAEKGGGGEGKLNNLPECFS
jgi:hypothetical protein